VFVERAPRPSAVLLLPAEFFSSALYPEALLPLPL
jgi:hypothetical protein